MEAFKRRRGVRNGQQTNNQRERFAGLPDPFLMNKMEEMKEILTNAVTSRMTQLYSSFNDPRRSIDDECGYPTGTSFAPESYRDFYDREPIANRVVELMPKECWQVSPLVWESDNDQNDTEFEKAFDELSQKLMSGSLYQSEEGSPIWEHLSRIDMMSGIGQFGVLLLGIDDGKNLQDPVDGAVTLNGKNQPIYKTVTNARGKTVQKQVGTKRKLISRTSLWPDSPAHPRWIANLQALETQTMQETTINQSLTKEQLETGANPDRPMTDKERFERPGSSRKLTTNEQRVVEGWEREAQEFWAKHKDVTINRVNDGAGTGDDRKLVEMTDQMGTDQQYFGVQFGPTELPVKPEEGSSKKNDLLFIKAFDESLVQVVRWEWNVKNPRFGMPVMYRVTLNDPRNRYSGVGLPLATVFVHWTRIVHVADNLLSSEVMGTPRMKPVLNRLLDLRKIYGASAEGYWKAVVNLLSFETHPQLGGEVDVDTGGMQDMMEQVMNGLQRYVTGIGGGWKSIAPSVVDPTPHVTVQIEAICIKLGCPVRVFKGSERGELASSQDDSQWNDRIRNRQNCYVTPRLIVPFIDRLIVLGVLPAPEGYQVEWPDLDSLGEKDKAAIAVSLATAITTFVSGGGEQGMTLEDFYETVFGWDKEKVNKVVKNVKRQQEEDEQDAQDVADEHGMIPAPPEGFQNKPMPPAVPPASPIKVKPGEKLVHPDSVKPPQATLPKDQLPKDQMKQDKIAANSTSMPKEAWIGNEEEEDDEEVENQFCPTGEGGGVDASCSPGTQGAEKGLLGKAKEKFDSLTGAISKTIDKVPVIGTLKDKMGKAMDKVNQFVEDRYGKTAGKIIMKSALYGPTSIAGMAMGLKMPGVLGFNDVLGIAVSVGVAESCLQAGRAWKKITGNEEDQLPEGFDHDETMRMVRGKMKLAIEKVIGESKAEILKALTNMTQVDLDSIKELHSNLVKE